MRRRRLTQYAKEGTRECDMAKTSLVTATGLKTVRATVAEVRDWSMARLVESAAVRVGFTGGLGTRNERPGFKGISQVPYVLYFFGGCPSTV